MKKLFLKTMLLLCALIVGSSSLWAQATVHTTGTNITWSHSNGVVIGSTTYDACKIAKGSSTTVTVPAGTTKLYVHCAAWNKEGASLGISAPTGVTITPTSWTITADAGVSGSSTNFTLDASKVSTDYFHEFTLSGVSSAKAITFSCASNKRAVIWGINAESTAAGTTDAPSISGNTPFLNSTTVTISNASTATGASIYYTLNGDNPTTTTSSTCFEYTAPFEISATTTVKAIAKKSTDTNASSVTSMTFTKVTPISVADALTAIDALANNGTIDNQCVSGIIVSVGTTVDDGKIKYYISDDGTETNQLYIYKGKGLNNADFTAASDLKVGDEVVVFGQLKKYYAYSTVTPQFTEGSYLISKVSKPAPTFSLDVTEKTLDAYTHETVDVTLTTNTDGVVSCESSNEDVATVALKSAGVYTITAQSEGTATITIKSASSANYCPANAKVTITVTDNRADAGISFDNDEIAKTWGDSFTGQELNNANSLAVTYSSTNEAVATVSSTGVVTMLKAGTTTIKATFAGNATHKAAVASYDLTINKAEVDLSFTETEFNIPLNGSGFVAPTLVNPHNLVVTYSSNNTDIATINSSTGEITELITTATGTATITAYYAGDDCYNGGNAKYTITIYDPNVKGTKFNPYTVAEVKDGTATGSGIYVTGYIVGEFKSGADPATSNFTTDANIAIADEFTTSPTKNASIPVNLSSNSHKNTWGNQTNKGTTIGYKVLIKGNKDTYFSVNGIKSVTEVTGVSAIVSVSSAGLATFASNCKLDFENVENLEAYIAKENNSKIELTKVEKVAAGTGVLLRALNDATTFEVPVTTDDADDVTGNIFVRGTGAAVESDPAAGGHNYILSKKGDVYGFYLANGNKVAKNRAYLHTSVAAARIDLNFDNATGINEVKSEKTVEGIFDLQGRKVVTPSKGLYIVNGKKVVIK